VANRQQGLKGDHHFVVFYKIANEHEDFLRTHVSTTTTLFVV
jgi:hypothetical protein